MSKDTTITIYVSQEGDDTNEGSQALPLASVAAALSKIRGQSYESATIIISGSITEVAAKEGMIDITGHGLPPIVLQGESEERPGILNADKLNKRVIFISDDNTLTLGDHITLTGGSTSNNGGSGVAVQRGTLIMNGGEIADNDSLMGMGGGVYIGKGGSFTMNGGAIVRNKTQMNGGGVFPDDGGVFTMNGGCISNNNAYMSGAGVFVGMDSQFTLNGGTIEKNQSGGDKDVLIFGRAVPYGRGGGVCVYERAVFTMNGGDITKNRAIAMNEDENSAGSGGGVFVQEGAVFTFKKGTIKQGGVMGWGGGIYSEGKVTMYSDSVICNNVARLCGGGVHLAGKGASLTMKGGLIMNNFGARSAGAVHIMKNSIFTIEQGLIVKNTAGEGGHALVISGTVVMNGGVIVDNNDEALERMTPEPDKKSPKKSQRKAAKAGAATADPAIVIEYGGKLRITGGELQGQLAMVSPDQLEDTR
ncbi:hypothetical protein ACYULU_14895 [Breznakiellaceae bacterium SP9]